MQIKFLNTFYIPDVNEQISNWEKQRLISEHHKELCKLDDYNYALHKEKLHKMFRKEIKLVTDNRDNI